MDNYQKAADRARQYFLTYDWEEIRKKFSFPWDDAYLYPTLLGRLHRLGRRTGSLEIRRGDSWIPAEDFDRVMVLLDLLCDSDPGRHLSGRLKSTQEFGLCFHRQLLEQRDPLGDYYDLHPEQFPVHCRALGGTMENFGDLSCRIPLMEELAITLVFWHSDGEFPPSIRFLWDENAGMYLKYETMHYALGLLRQALTDLQTDPGVVE